MIMFYIGLRNLHLIDNWKYAILLAGVVAVEAFIELVIIANFILMAV